MGIGVYVCIQKLVYAYKHMGCQGFFIALKVYVYTGRCIEAAAAYNAC